MAPIVMASHLCGGARSRNTKGSLVTVAVGKTRLTHDMILSSGVFAINLLGPDGVSEARRFGLKSGRDTDKFAGVEYDTKATGSPILKSSVAWLDCRVVAHHEAGDHTLIVGEVIDGAVTSNEEPMRYVRDDIFS